MKLIIGDYYEGRLTPAYHESGDEIPKNVLEELKGRFTKEYREANITLTEQQLLAAATPDQDIIQAVHALENLDVMLNSTGKYTTEWYELHHPQEDVIWTELCERSVEEPGLAELNAAVKRLVETRDTIIKHLETQMQTTMPNVNAIAGSFIGAKLLAGAGNMRRFAMMPSTTIQLLGAEQALFRHLRNRNALPPKYGILFNHPLVQKLHPRQKGKMARQLANAISLASRIDYFKGEYYGDTLKQKTEAAYNALARS